MLLSRSTNLLPALAALVLTLGIPFSGCGGDEFATEASGGSGAADASPDQSNGGASGGDHDAGKGGASGGGQDAGKGGAAGKAGAAGAAGKAGAAGAPGAGGATPDACIPETADELCQAKNAKCGTITGQDSCGGEYSYACGVCECGSVCSTSSSCEPVACTVNLGAEGCSCDQPCCSGTCNGGTCCVGSGASCGSGTQCGENSNCCSGKCNNGQCWGGDLTCTVRC